MTIPELKLSVLRVRAERQRQAEGLPPIGEEDAYDAAILKLAAEAAKGLRGYGEQEAGMPGKLTAGMFAVVDAAITLFEAYRDAGAGEVKSGAHVIAAELRFLCAIRLLG